jgi:aromatic-L-amino-acid decarboxylase
VAPVTLQTVCVRHEPPGVEGDALDEHTRRWTQTVNDSGRAYLTPAIAKGRWMTRISIGGEYTSLVHVKELWDIVRDAASASGNAR